MRQDRGFGRFVRRRPMSTGNYGPDQRPRPSGVGSLRIRYPKLATALGDGFAAIAAAFEVREPTDPWQLPSFLAASLSYPLWYAELAALERARADLGTAPRSPRMDRMQLIRARDLGSLRIQLVPAHALVALTTNADELWADPTVLPVELDWPRTTILWHDTHAVRSRTAEPDELTALHAAAPGASLADLAHAFLGGNPFARTVDFVLRWIEDGLVA